jgi:hypothetical protein
MLGRKQELSIPAIEALYEMYCHQIWAKRVPRVLILSTDLSVLRCTDEILCFIGPPARSPNPPRAPRPVGWKLPV